MKAQTTLLVFLLIGLTVSFRIPEVFHRLFGQNTVNYPKTVDHVDLKRFSGRWYEQAQIPMIYTQGCVKTTATYDLPEKGHMEVEFGCIRNDKQIKADMKLKVADKSTNAIFDVAPEYWPWFLSDSVYTVRLGDNYEYFVQSDAHYKVLNIYSREPFMPETTYQMIVESLRQEKKYRVNELVRTTQ